MPKFSFKPLESSDFFSPFYTRKALENAELEAFNHILQEYLAFLEANATQSEDFLVSNALAPRLFEKLGFECAIKHKQKGKSEIDLALKKDNQVSIIIEAKHFAKPQDMFSAQNTNCKALHESILYYLRERIQNANSSIKHIIITNFKQFYIFKGAVFERLFYDNKAFQNLYENFTSPNSLLKGNTEEFYAESSKILDSQNYLDSITHSAQQDSQDLLAFGHLQGLCIDLAPLRHFTIPTDSSPAKSNPLQKHLHTAFKALHRDLLLDEFSPNDANILNQAFYDELLYILGLQEASSEGKIIITQSKATKEGKNTLYNAIMLKLNSKLDSSDKAFEIALSLIITWLNRILFLKLIEANLVRFNDDKSLKFLSKVPNFKALSTLFFEILAKRHTERSTTSELTHLPYLNSSLFEKKDFEKEWLDISALSDDIELDYYAQTQIRDKNAKKKQGKVRLLAYLFEFLDSFDFGSDEHQGETIAQKELINSAVLGLVFEKLNGYKDGSFYTPSFITSYMCKQSLEKVVIAKFNESFKWQCDSLEALRKRIDRDFDTKAQDFKNTLKNIKICDPAVGSGHFLVSALNEMIYIYHKLGLLDFGVQELKLQNDEILITTTHGALFAYKRRENHAIQKALFDLKKSIIENNLFGVDINENSCEITKLRLWIELLKNAYYLNQGDEGYEARLDSRTHQMQTLPNIDINIKCGNSLISRYDLSDSFRHIPNIAKRIDEYKNLVMDYKNSDRDALKATKSQIIDKINEIKASFTLTLKDPKTKSALQNAIESHIANFGNYLLDDTSLLDGLDLKSNQNLFGADLKLDSAQQDAALESYGKIAILRKKLDSATSGESFLNALEWRFEFPEILDSSSGDFKGFDLVIGNPPYIKEADNKKLFENTKNLRTYQGKMDIWYHFVGRGFDLVKNQGIVIFIATNNWTTSAGAQKLRNVILSESQILNLVDFGSYMVFDQASIQTMIMEFQKSKSIPKSYTFNYAKIESKKPTDSHREFVLNREIFADNIYLTPTITPKTLLDKTLTFIDSNKDLVLNKMLKNGKFYLQDKEIAQGIVPNPDCITAKNITKKLIDNDIKIGDEVFVITKGSLKTLNKNEKTILKPLFEVENCLKYYLLPNNIKEIIYTTKTNCNIEDIPNLAKHLARFKDIMNARRENINGRLQFFHLHWARDSYFFEKGAKILSVRKCPNQPIFSYTEIESYVMLSLNVIKTKRIDMKYLVGILNSKLVAFWLKHKGKMQGNNYQIDKEPLLNIPIPQITADNKAQKALAEQITQKVEDILRLKSQTPPQPLPQGEGLSSANSSIPCEVATKNSPSLAEGDLGGGLESIQSKIATLESQINALVYKLYDLNADEIAIIES